MKQSVAFSRKLFSPFAELTHSIESLIKKFHLEKRGIACLAASAFLAAAPAFAQKPIVPIPAPATQAEASSVAHPIEKTQLDDRSRKDIADSHSAPEVKAPSSAWSSTSSVVDSTTTAATAGFFMTSPASASGATTAGAAMSVSTSADSKPAEQGSLNPASAAAVAYPRAITISFPSAPVGESVPSSKSAPTPATNGFVASSEATRAKGFVVEGESRSLSDEPPQRGVAPPHASAPIRTAPMTSAPVVSVPLAPTGGIRIAPIRPMRGRALVNGAPFWFLARPVAGTPRVFGPRRGRPRFGGFGFFPGFGFGFPFFGFGFGFAADCNPYWAWPWAYGCGSLGYWDGYNAGFLTGDNSQLIEPEEPAAMEPEQQEPETFTYIPPPDESSPEEIEAEKVLTVLYMKDGSVYAVTNYWVEGGKLHYKTSYGGEDTIDMDKIDLQKTVDVNAKRGVQFTLKPTPDQNPPNPQPPQQQNLPEPQD